MVSGLLSYFLHMNMQGGKCGHKRFGWLGHAISSSACYHGIGVVYVSRLQLMDCVAFSSDDLLQMSCVHFGMIDQVCDPFDFEGLN